MAEMNYASNGKGNLGVTLGAIGTGLGLFGGGAGNLLGGLFGGGYNPAMIPAENQAVNRYEAQQQARIAELETEVKLRDANTYTDQKLLEVYKDLNGQINGINNRLCEQSVWNATQTATIGCMGQQIAALQGVLGGITKTVIPKDVICPEVMARYNSWTAPTETPATGG